VQISAYKKKIVDQLQVPNTCIYGHNLGCSKQL
jgi:hypothetical protein